uniref:Uncharacterized protein n=1 Tax=viral metagenome TaxID=1070528 RepID=A0A6H2A362_9ZZZZ
MSSTQNLKAKVELSLRYIEVRGLLAPISTRELSRFVAWLKIDRGGFEAFHRNSLNFIFNVLHNGYEETALKKLSRAALVQHIIEICEVETLEYDEWDKFTSWINARVTDW